MILERLEHKQPKLERGPDLEAQAQTGPNVIPCLAQRVRHVVQEALAYGVVAPVVDSQIHRFPHLGRVDELELDGRSIKVSRSYIIGLSYLLLGWEWV